MRAVLGWPEVRSVELSALYPGGGGADVPLGAAKRTADGAWVARVRLQRGFKPLYATPLEALGRHGRHVGVNGVDVGAPLIEVVIGGLRRRLGCARRAGANAGIQRDLSLARWRAVALRVRAAR